MNEAPLWVEDIPQLAAFETLKGNHSADIVIIGAGIAGLSLAYHLTRLGYEPTILEEGLPGNDATGKSAGIITSLPVLRRPTDLLHKCGTTMGKKMLSLFGDSGRYTFSLIENLGLDCGHLSNGFLAPARPVKSVEKLEIAGAEWQSLGYDIKFIDERDTRRLTGLDIYRGALFDPNGGAMNPLAYAMELARVVQDAGARIFTHSKVNNIDRDNVNWNLTCENGTVKASQVVLCAGGGNRFLHSSLAQSALPLHVYQMATAPLSEDQQSMILPEKHSMTDVHPNIFSMRYDIKNRLVTACPAFLFGNSVNRARNSVLKRLKKITPILDSVDIRHVWRGTVWINRSILPKFYLLSEGLYEVQACNGRGLAINTILGKDLAEYIHSKGAQETRIQAEIPDSIPVYRFASLVPQLLINSARFRSTIFEKILR